MIIFEISTYYILIVLTLPELRGKLIPSKLIIKCKL